MAGTVTQTYYNLGTIKKVVFTCTADSGDGSFPATAMTTKIEGFLLTVETNPSGVTAPQANYDIVLTNANSVDVLQSLCVNRHTANTEVATIVVGTYFHPAVSLDDTLTLAVTGNNVNSAITVITMYYSVASG
ncbi:MAG: hypothetical protein CMB80_02705 [Flammeovirgaceae bacterium]|nr:hypothetical protein [Flammeovirgaceae bacterium]|tara:strand:+ start:259 stop:657 length:399 start_codon:yes stop_codon:yes gene_type:complete